MRPAPANPFVVDAKRLPQPYRHMWESIVVLMAAPSGGRFGYPQWAPWQYRLTFSSTTNNADRVVTEQGYALYHDGLTSSVLTAGVFAFLKHSTTWPAFTVFTLSKRDGASVTFRRHMRGGNAGNIDWSLGEGNSGELRFATLNTSGASDNAGSTQDMSVWHTAVGTWDLQTKRLYYQGREVATSTPTNVRCRSDNTNEIRLCESTSGMKAWHAIQGLALGAWGPAEAAAFHRDPWGFLRPRNVALLDVPEFSYMVPTSTIAAGGWTATGAGTLYEAIDEITANDSDYIEYDPPDPNPDTVKFGLTNITTGVGEGDVTLKIRTEATEL